MRVIVLLAAALAGALGALPVRAENRPEETGQRECLSTPVVIMRAHSRPLEAGRLALTRCDGSPNPGVLPELSALARPAGTERPDRSGEVFTLHPGLLSRLQTLSDRWPGRRIEIVSGYRPDARRGSRHRSGRALDIRIRGVSRRTVSEFARTMSDTGVGFYPNSLFTHIDVREGQTYWIDESRPGEPARYVKLDENGSQPAPAVSGPEFDTGGRAAAPPGPETAALAEPAAILDEAAAPQPAIAEGAQAPWAPSEDESILRVEGAVVASSSHVGSGNLDKESPPGSSKTPETEESRADAPRGDEAPLPTANLTRTEVERIRKSALLALEALREGAPIKDR